MTAHFCSPECHARYVYLVLAEYRAYVAGNGPFSRALYLKPAATLKHSLAKDDIEERVDNEPCRDDDDKTDERIFKYIFCLLAFARVARRRKDNARLIVSQVILNAFNEFKMAYPKTTPIREKELKSIRKQLEKTKQ